MAQIKAFHPVFSPIDSYDVSTHMPVYDGGVVLGKMISTGVTPQYDSASLYGDDALAEQENALIAMDVTLNTTDLSPDAVNIMYGTTKSGAAGSEVLTDKVSNVAPYGGYGYAEGIVVDSVRKFKTTWLYKTRFTKPPETATTRGESTTYGTPTITGRAIPLDDEDGTIREVKYHASATAAISYLDTKADISAAAASTNTSNNTETGSNP